MRPHRAGRRAAARGHRRPRPARLAPASTRPCRRSSRRPGRRDVRRHAGRRGPRAVRRGLRAGRAGRASTRRSSCCASSAPTVVEVSCPHFAYALPAYYLIAPSEASSNLARFDACGTACGSATTATRGLEEVMALTREAGLRRRGQAPHHPRHVRAVQRLLRRLLRPGAEGPHADHARLPRGVRRRRRAGVSPTAPTVAFPLGAKLADPLAMYRQDLAHDPVQPVRRPGHVGARGLSDGLPVGLQVMARRCATTC